MEIYYLKNCPCQTELKPTKKCTTSIILRTANYSQALFTIFNNDETK